MELLLKFLPALLGTIAFTAFAVVQFRRLAEMHARAMAPYRFHAQARVLRKRSVMWGKYTHLELELHPLRDDAAAYRDRQAPATMAITANAYCQLPLRLWGQIKRGMMVPVKYDPANPSTVLVDFDSMKGLW